MAALLRKLLAAQRTDPTSVGDVPADYLGRLVRAFEQDAAHGERTAVVSGLVTQLSERELEVLRHLAAGEQNQEIADQLFLALNTVKKHVTHIFDTLGDLLRQIGHDERVHKLESLSAPQRHQRPSDAHPDDAHREADAA